jgi:hypothetical protein
VRAVDRSLVHRFDAQRDPHAAKHLSHHRDLLGRQVRCRLTEPID